MQAPVRLIRVTEFLFRRSDASGDIYPDDPDHGVIEGPDPDRVLFLGEPGMISLGVRTHELSLPAFFARHHNRETHRGVHWRIKTLPHARLAEAPALIGTIEETLTTTDLVVILTGITDALHVTHPKDWEQQLHALLEALGQHLSRDARILIGDIPPLDNAGSLSRPARIAAGIQGRTLNRHTRFITRAYPHVDTVPFPEELTRSLWLPQSEEKRYTTTYNTWAAQLATHVHA